MKRCWRRSTTHLGHIMVFTMNYALYTGLPEDIRVLVDQCAAQALEAARAASARQLRFPIKHKK